MKICLGIVIAVMIILIMNNRKEKYEAHKFIDPFYTPQINWEELNECLQTHDSCYIPYQ